MVNSPLHWSESTAYNAWQMSTALHKLSNIAPPGHRAHKAGEAVATGLPMGARSNNRGGNCRTQLLAAIFSRLETRKIVSAVRLVLRTAVTPPVWRRAPPVARRAHRICHWQRT